jgi:hypothetical protein
VTWKQGERRREGWLEGGLPGAAAKMHEDEPTSGTVAALRNIDRRRWLQCAIRFDVVWTNSAFLPALVTALVAVNVENRVGEAGAGQVRGLSH